MNMKLNGAKPFSINRRSTAFYVLVSFGCILCYWLSEYRHISRTIDSMTRAANKRNLNDAVAEIDTAIIISTSWIPTHPSTAMLDKVIESIEYLKGLSPSTPIFVVVDHMKLPGTPGAVRYRKQDRVAPHLPTQEEMDTLVAKQASLDGYVQNLYSKYLLNPTVHIVPSVDHWHIGGTVLKAMNLVEEHYPSVEYLYYLQHDFAFLRPVDHIAIRDLINENDNVNYIRFRYKYSEKFDHHTCPMGAPIENVTQYHKNDITIFQTALYTDQNHFVRFSWYRDEVIQKINGGGSEPLSAVKRAPEGPLMKRAKQDCMSLGLFTYGEEFGEKPVMVNLDGRLTENLSSDATESSS